MTTARAEDDTISPDSCESDVGEVATADEPGLPLMKQVWGADEEVLRIAAYWARGLEGL